VRTVKSRAARCRRSPHLIGDHSRNISMRGRILDAAAEHGAGVFGRGRPCVHPAQDPGFDQVVGEPGLRATRLFAVVAGLNRVAAFTSGDGLRFSLQIEFCGRIWLKYRGAGCVDALGCRTENYAVQ